MNLRNCLYSVTLGLGLFVGSDVGRADPDAPTTLSAAGADASIQWSDIKDTTYEMRAHFLTGAKQLEGRVDVQIRELRAKRGTMEGKVDTREWDFAMKEMESTRSYLAAVIADLGDTSQATWDQDKDKVGRAWVASQDAYGRVKASTTI